MGKSEYSTQVTGYEVIEVKPFKELSEWVPIGIIQNIVPASEFMKGSVHRGI